MKIDKKVIVLLIVMFCCIGIVIRSAVKNNDGTVKITPIKALSDIHSGETLLLKNIYLGKEKRVSKKEADNYLTFENYKRLLDNDTFFKQDVQQGADLMLDNF